MRKDAKTVSEWEFDRIIPCHGVSFYFLSIGKCTEQTVYLGRHHQRRQEGLVFSHVTLPLMCSSIAASILFLYRGDSHIRILSSSSQ